MEEQREYHPVGILTARVVNDVARSNESAYAVLAHALCTGERPSCADHV